jgi:hypothetical protein
MVWWKESINLVSEKDGSLAAGFAAPVACLTGESDDALAQASATPKHDTQAPDNEAVHTVAKMHVVGDSGPRQTWLFCPALNPRITDRDIDAFGAMQREKAWAALERLYSTCR